MIFDRKIGEKGMRQLRSVLEEVMADALGRQEQELTRRQAEQTAWMDMMMEKNQKTVRSLSDTVEDFLDTIQEENDGRRQSQQLQKAAGEQEKRLPSAAAGTVPGADGTV